MNSDLILRSRAFFARRLEGWPRVPVLPILRDARKVRAPQDEARDGFTSYQDGNGLPLVSGSISTAIRPTT
jgi:hypothetical protein